MHSSWLHNRFQCVHGRVTPYFNTQRHPYRGLVLAFGEPVVLQLSKNIGKLAPRGVEGIWLGRSPISDEHVVGTPSGVLFGRTARPIEKSQATSGLYAALNITPAQAFEPVTAPTSSSSPAQPSTGHPLIELPPGGLEGFLAQHPERAGVMEGRMSQGFSQQLRREYDRRFREDCGPTEGCGACGGLPGRKHTNECWG